MRVFVVLQGLTTCTGCCAERVSWEEGACSAKEGVHNISGARGAEPSSVLVSPAVLRRGQRLLASACARAYERSCAIALLSRPTRAQCIQHHHRQGPCWLPYHTGDYINAAYWLRSLQACVLSIRPAGVLTRRRNRLMRRVGDLGAGLQECMEAIKGAIGMEGAQRLWVPLLKQHSANPVNLQWLPLLACWLSSTAGAEVARQQRSSAQTRPKSRSSSPKKPNSSPRRHGQEKEEEGHKAASPAAADRNHLTGGEEDGASCFPYSLSHTSMPPHLPLLETHKRGTQSLCCKVRGCCVFCAGGVLLDRNAEEALQLQEAAMRVGYGAAALPMWEEFLSRYFHYLACAPPSDPDTFLLYP